MIISNILYCYVGDILNVLKGKKARSSKAFKQFSNDNTATSTTTASSLSSGLDSNHNIINTIASDDDDDNDNNINFDINSAFSGSSSAEDALKNMNPEDIKAAMQSMDKMLDSNIIEDYFSDEQKLETARLQMLNNLDQYEQMMPGRILYNVIYDNVVGAMYDDMMFLIFCMMMEVMHAYPWWCMSMIMINVTCLLFVLLTLPSSSSSLLSSSS